MLSEKTAKEAKPTDKPQKLPHEKGLYLYISPKGGSRGASISASLKNAAR